MIFFVLDKSVLFSETILSTAYKDIMYCVGLLNWEASELNYTLF